MEILSCRTPLDAFFGLSLFPFPFSCRKLGWFQCLLREELATKILIGYLRDFLRSFILEDGSFLIDVILVFYVFFLLLIEILLILMRYFILERP